jgi:hypothetical protein
VTFVSDYGSITIVKTFTYRDAPEEYTNTYHFRESWPADDTHWKTLADAVIAAEKAVHLPDSVIVRAIGHKGGDKIAVFDYDYLSHSTQVAGTFSGGGGPTSGDVAGWVRWPTTAKTSNGKPIFLRSYFHNCTPLGFTATTKDEPHGLWKTAMETFGNAWVTGFSDGANTYHRCGPKGATGGTAVACTYLTTRTLERRGKRRPPA